MPGALISKGDLMLFTGSADTRGAPSLNTDYLDVDKIVDVPDTPERVYIGQEDIETDSSSGTGHPRNSVFTYGAMERKDGNNQIASEMRRKENLHPHHGRQFDDSDQMPRPSVQAVGSSSINRIVGKAKREGRYDVGTQQGGDRMAECSKILSVPSKRKGIAVETNSLPNDFKAQKRREGSLVINGVSSHTVGDTSKSSNHASKGKAKVGDHNDGHFEVSGRGRGELSHDGVSERKSGKSASVPLRTVVVPSMMGRKKLVRHGCISPHNIAKAKASLESSSDFGNVKTPVASGGTRHETNANKATAKENNLDQFKGKGFLFRPCSSREYELRNAASFDRKDTVGSSANQQHKGSIQDTDDIFQRASNSQAGDLCIKGQKKCDVGSSSQKSKREIMRLGSQEALSSRSTGRSPQIIEIPELAPEVRQRSSMTDDDLEARVRQVQADEMFACELQEQLYNEVTEVASVESGALMSHARRQPRSRTLHRRSVHRGTQAHIPTSRTRGLRDRIARRSSAVPFRQRHILFPSEMDLDMRLELLEAMEAVVDYDIRMVNQLLDSDREFNENDYETLLALDENNHQHVGASFDQVANLPQSIVQSDSFEDCSICLETPAIGDTIRHLPCLHKFHKDCIDPWLRRKRSCPVCKSDIT